VRKTKENSGLQILSKLISWGLVLLVAFIGLKMAHAQGYLGSEWDQFITDVQTVGNPGATGEELAAGFVKGLIRILRNIVGAVALILGIIYGLKFVMARGQEEVITKQKQNFLYALMGFLVLIISENVAGIFNPETSTNDALIDFGAARDQLRDIVDYVKWILGSMIVLMMAISSIRLVTAGGEEEVITKQKRNLTWSFMGMLFILLANNIVNAIYVINAPDETVAAAPTTAIGELTSLVRLLLVFLGPMAIVFTIYAGFVYLTALDNEERANQGKRMIVAGIVAIVIIYGAYAIVNTITSANLALLNPYLS